MPDDALTDLQREVLGVFFALPESAEFVLAGGAALIASGLSERPTQDVDLFTGDLDRGITDAADALEAACVDRGWTVEHVRSSATFRRIEIHTTSTQLLVDLAVDSPPLGTPTVTTVGPTYPGITPDQSLIDGLENYGWNKHRDTFAGLWIDQTRNGTVVVLFTDDPTPHRTEAIRLGAAAEPGRVVEVVQVAHSQRDLDGLRAEVEGAMKDPELGVGAVATNVPANRVAIGLTALSGDTERRKLAEQFGGDAVCVATFEHSYFVTGG